ncbi:MAG: hypothetical protein MZV70_30190 [Desulfobacterales bacterium]|nr:hypothetical protein [Desulfobacterales bacterium]
MLALLALGAGVALVREPTLLADLARMSFHFRLPDHRTVPDRLERPRHRRPGPRPASAPAHARQRDHLHGRGEQHALPGPAHHGEGRRRGSCGPEPRRDRPRGRSHVPRGGRNGRPHPLRREDRRRARDPRELRPVRRPVPRRFGGHPLQGLSAGDPGRDPALWGLGAGSRSAGRSEQQGGPLHHLPDGRLGDVEHGRGLCGRPSPRHCLRAEVAGL